MAAPLLITRQPGRILPDTARVVARPFVPSDARRAQSIAARVLSLSDQRTETLLAETLALFAHRHRDFEAILESHYWLVQPHLPRDVELSQARKLLLGAYFTHEYSFEAAALFNPSIVRHPDQAGLAPGEARVIVSFRATGEGHISSLEFREGVVSSAGALRLEPASRFAQLPAIGTDGTLHFPASIPLSERLLFPVTPDERNGVEDARWVQFLDDQEETYYGTYVAFDGSQIWPKLFETSDFISFRTIPLTGNAVRNKGFALFPRRVHGLYVMLSRQDNEHNYIMFSQAINRWEEAQLLRGPAAPHEFVQIGNNGSPVETEVGWLLLTHGVGPMRRYTLGVDLLDLDDPGKVLAHLDEPLLVPDESEREGYVPNVVYTCGALLHEGLLIIPYAMSDSACGVATFPVATLLARLGV